MDPLVDEYSRLDADKGEVIDPKIFQQAISDTRKFLIKVGLSSLTLMALSIFKVL